ncbi:Kinase-like protein [Mycena sanguinolenta]|uniref:Kinase-like protein n=1 Tax=Mycena sanguinolenta TaxID=230812 RepID=A0A8H6TX12_9AGAR|nr:Kinase-like protein [Mycena sanguinolenta]
MQAVDRVVTNYNYYISGGVGGPGGGARDQGTGGGGGAGHGPTVYLGQPPEETTSRDLDLLKEIRLEEQSRVVDRPSRGASVRRMYSANFVVRESERRVTVAMYQGDGAEDEWRQDFAKYESIRHPNILQLYGIVNAKKLCAMVFHDELIPYGQFLSRFEHSPILTTYILSYCITEWWEAMDYYDSILRKSDLAALPLWIRPATGQLCVDLSHGQEQDNILLDTGRHGGILRLENIPLDDPNTEARNDAHTCTAPHTPRHLSTDARSCTCTRTAPPKAPMRPQMPAPVLQGIAPTPPPADARTRTRLPHIHARTRSRSRGGLHFAHALPARTRTRSRSRGGRSVTLRGSKELCLLRSGAFAPPPQ